MKEFIHKPGIRYVSPIIFIGLALILLRAGNVCGAVSSGLSLNLYADEQNHPQLQYQLGVDQIKITMVIKNNTQWPINTDRGFSQVNLQKALILTDPSGTRHAFSTDKAKAFDVLPAISWNQIPAVEAEILPSPWARSVIIEDLRSTFPMMNKIPGWYTVEAQQPFVRFAWTVQAEPVGILGPQKDPDNWEGTVDSNKLQIFVAPASGAQLEARVLDGSAQPTKPIAQVPVRVFKQSEIPSGNPPQDTWDKVAYVLEGSTNPEGWAVWGSDSDVQCLPQAEYVVMAHYLDQYKQSAIAEGSAEGWAAGCEGSIVKEIVFGEAPPPPAEKVITVSGSASNYPDGKRYRADFSMDVTTENGSPSGWLKYNFEKRWWFFKIWIKFTSTEITEVVGSDGNTATIRGKGTVNGAGNYTFEAVVTDNSPDSFGITIKDQKGKTYYSASPKNISHGDLQVSISEAPPQPPPVEKVITVSGSASNYPEGNRYKADFSMDVQDKNGSPSGWLKYNFEKRWWFFKIWIKLSSTEITEVVVSDGNTATIRGKGTVNGAGNYTFEAVVIDNNPDRFGITIKDRKGKTYYSASPKNISHGDLKVAVEE